MRKKTILALAMVSIPILLLLAIGECLGATEGGGRSPFFHAAHFSGETGGLLQGLLREASSNYDLLPGGLYPGLNG